MGSCRGLWTAMLFLTTFYTQMSYLRPSDVAVLISGASFTSYLIFKSYEPSSLSVLVALLLLVPGLLSIPSTQLSCFSSLGAALLTTYISYYALILTYVTVYRLSPLHPLAKYPGPYLNKLSKLWMVWITSKGRQHIYYQTLHERYGNVVRIGPNELSIRDVDAIEPVLGTTGLPKGPFWDNRTGPEKGSLPSLIATRDPIQHAQRRKPWTRAFSSSALRNYEDPVIDSSKQLVEALEKRPGQVLDISMWMSYFALDFMGEMAFGQGYDLMSEGGDSKGLRHILDDGLEFIVIAGHIPWAIPVLGRLPGPGNANARLREFGKASAQRRIKAGSERRDLFYHLIDEDGIEPVKRPIPLVISDGVLAVIAGSDTTATSLTALWYYLLRNRFAYDRLRAEIDANFPPGEEPLDLGKMARMPYLNACLNEALRLLPAVLSGAQRSVLPGTGGKAVGTLFIPEGTQVFVHTYSLQRDPRYFSPYPDSFWPDRWLPDADRQYPPGFKVTSPVILNTAAFIPFSYGPAVCAGKNLALMELRAVACFVLHKFDICPAEKGIDGWEESVEDYFTAKRGELPVVLKTRT